MIITNHEESQEFGGRQHAVLRYPSSLLHVGLQKLLDAILALTFAIGPYGIERGILFRHLQEK